MPDGGEHRMMHSSLQSKIHTFVLNGV